ncbi:MAG TPA: M64 family metallopeptidase, partial [Bacteroidia bacterium]|nr:M64 family metallopeptidase [Bacteroidia bacterium]
MKKNTITAYFCLLALCLSAQKFKVDTIQYSGPTSNRVNLVIMGDGYTSSEQTKFLNDAKSINTKFFQTTPYTEYKNYFNIFAVEVISSQSGASHSGNSSDNACGSQPTASVNNYFGSAFDAGGGGYHRLLVVTKNSAVTNVLATNTPFYDQALVIVNTTYYGGAGGQYAVSSMASSASEIAIHECGHSFSNLADEYWAGSQYATDSKPNMTSNGNTSTVKWKIWNGVNSVGVYPHTGDPNWFKPTSNNCKMEVLGKTFCPVCREAHIEKIHSLVKPYDDFTPANTSTIPIDISNVQFSVNAILPIQNTLKVEWLLNGTTVNGNSLTYSLPASSVSGTQQLQAKLIDTTGLVRIATHATQHVYLITWNV